MPTPLDMPARKAEKLREVKQTIVIEGSRLGAEFACTLALSAGLLRPEYRMRKDESVLVWAYSIDQHDKDARARWVKQCKSFGLKVKRAPWEKGK